MKDGQTKACVFAGLVVTCYAIYTVSNPGADGLVFGSVIGAIAAIGGYAVGIVKGKSPDV